MELVFLPNGWDDYLYWQATDKKMLKRINLLVRDAMREPFQGIGKPEPLKANFTGWWSRRINSEHRLVYRVDGNRFIVMKCRYHY